MANKTITVIMDDFRTDGRPIVTVGTCPKCHVERILVEGRICTDCILPKYGPPGVNRE